MIGRGVPALGNAEQRGQRGHGQESFKFGQEVEVKVAPQWAKDFSASVRSRFDEVDTRSVMDAYKLATRLRGKQEAVENPSQVEHVESVAQRVLGFTDVPTANGEHRDLIIAALLHESVEVHADRLAGRRQGPRREHETNRDIALEVITQKYGARVRQFVDKLSTPDIDAELVAEGMAGDDPEYMRERGVRYIDYVRQAIRDPYVLRVKFADLLDNVERVAGTSTETEHGRAEQTRRREECAALIDVFRGEFSRKQLPESYLTLLSMADLAIAGPDERGESLEEKTQREWLALLARASMLRRSERVTKDGQIPEQLRELYGDHFAIDLSEKKARDLYRLLDYLDGYDLEAFARDNYKDLGIAPPERLPLSAAVRGARLHRDKVTARIESVKQALQELARSAGLKSSLQPSRERLLVLSRFSPQELQQFAAYNKQEVNGAYSGVSLPETYGTDLAQAFEYILRHKVLPASVKRSTVVDAAAPTPQAHPQSVEDAVPTVPPRSQGVASVPNPRQAESAEESPQRVTKETAAQPERLRQSAIPRWRKWLFPWSA